MKNSNFPNGFANGVTIRGLPILNSYSGDIYFVSSTEGSDGNKGTYDRPFATIDYAIGRCTANNGDLILVKSGHAETISTASGITADVAGISIIGLGAGADRPEITFGTITGASLVASADNVTIQNIVGIAALDGLTLPFSITGDNCHIDIEWRDASSTVEAATVVRLDTANHAYVNLVYKGFTAGNAAVRVIAIDDCDNVKIDIDAYGVVSTAWVNMVDVASTNVSVRGRLYTQGITNFTRNVVDTVGGSTWDAQIFDASAGFSVSGGSAAALASDDITSVASDVIQIREQTGGVDSSTNILGADNNNNTFSSTSVVSNADGSIIERIEYLQGTQTVASPDSASNGITAHVIGNKNDAEVQAVAGDKSLVGYIKGVLNQLSGATGISTYPTAAAPANGVSLAEVDRQIYNNTLMASPSDLSNNHFTVTADMTSATWNTAASHEIVTVTGQVEIKILPFITATLTSGGGTATLVLGDETTTNSLITSTDAENLATGEWWFDSTDTRTLAKRTVFESLEFVIGNGKDVGYTIGTEALTGGTITFYVWWKPMDATGNCVAGTGAAL